MNEEPVDYRSADEPAEPPLHFLTTCWRCRKAVAADTPTCPYCAARLAAPDMLHRASRLPAAERSPLLPVLVGFAILLGVNLLHALIIRVQATMAPAQAQPGSQELLVHAVIGELISTVVILIAVLRVRLPATPVAGSARILAWPLSLMGLAGGLALNLAYHRFLKDHLGMIMLENLLNDGQTTLGWWVFIICVQPAIVEELFFRHLVLGSLRTTLGGHGAVWLSSVMFALAHIGTPISLPVLMVLGVVLGYARWGSGGLALPMVLHFLHNLFVLLLEWR
jgi:uncharacterized protein